AKTALTARRRRSGSGPRTSRSPWPTSAWTRSSRQRNVNEASRAARRSATRSSSWRRPRSRRGAVDPAVDQGRQGVHGQPPHGPEVR
ncbi:hypothetical protein CTI14_65915, partial [Methylobacterium radiotolerans]